MVGEHGLQFLKRLFRVLITSDTGIVQNYYVILS